MRKPLAVLVWLIALAIPTPAFTQDPDWSFRDDDGVWVELKRRPVRLICLGPSIAETLSAIGARGLLVGADRHSIESLGWTDVAEVGTLRSPSLETIAALQPDLVLTSNHAARNRSSFRSMGLRTAALHPDGWEDIDPAIRLLGRLTGREAQAAQVADEMARRTRRVLSATSRIAADARPRVFVEIWPEPLRSAGAGTFVHDLIEKAGGVNIAADTPSPWPHFSLEALLERNPDVIITPIESSYRSLLSAKREHWNRLKAVEQGRILHVDGDRISRASYRLVEALESIAAFLHPQAFPPAAEAASPKEEENPGLLQPWPYQPSRFDDTREGRRP